MSAPSEIRWGGELPPTPITWALDPSVVDRVDTPGCTNGRRAFGRARLTTPLGNVVHTAPIALTAATDGGVSLEGVHFALDGGEVGSSLHDLDAVAWDADAVREGLPQPPPSWTSVPASPTAPPAWSSLEGPIQWQGPPEVLTRLASSTFAQVDVQDNALCLRVGDGRTTSAVGCARRQGSRLSLQEPWMHLEGDAPLDVVFGWGASPSWWVRTEDGLAFGTLAEARPVQVPATSVSGLPVRPPRAPFPTGRCASPGRATSLSPEQEAGLRGEVAVVWPEGDGPLASVPWRLHVRGVEVPDPTPDCEPAEALAWGLLTLSLPGDPGAVLRACEAYARVDGGPPEIVWRSPHCAAEVPVFAVRDGQVVEGSAVLPGRPVEVAAARPPSGSGSGPLAWPSDAPADLRALTTASVDFVDPTIACLQLGPDRRCVPVVGDPSRPGGWWIDTWDRWAPWTDDRSFRVRVGASGTVLEVRDGAAVTTARWDLPVSGSAPTRR